MDSLFNAPNFVSYAVVSFGVVLLLLMCFYRLYSNFRQKSPLRTVPLRRKTPIINPEVFEDMPNSIISEVRYSNREEDRHEYQSTNWRVLQANDSDSEIEQQTIDEGAAEVFDDVVTNIVDEPVELQDLIDMHEPIEEIPVQEEAKESPEWSPKTDHHAPQRAPEHDEDAANNRLNPNGIEDFVTIQLITPGRKVCISGLQIKHFMEERRIAFADGLFHYPSDSGDGRLFVIVNAMAPGQFDTRFDEIKTCGLLFVIDTRSFNRNLADTYQTMVDLAYEAANEFDAVLLDAQSSTVCKQSVDHQLNRFHAANLHYLSETAAGS